MKRKPWPYMGFVVLPADLNGSGIRWTCNCGLAFTLKADTKAGMRELIRHYRKDPCLACKVLAKAKGQP